MGHNHHVGLGFVQKSKLGKRKYLRGCIATDDAARGATQWCTSLKRGIWQSVLIVCWLEELINPMNVNQGSREDPVASTVGIFLFNWHNGDDALSVRLANMFNRVIQYHESLSNQLNENHSHI